MTNVPKSYAANYQGRCNDEVVGGTNGPQSYAAHAAAARSEAESGQCFMFSLACFHAF